jgi:Flp pilus assembly protein TadG
MHKIFDLLKRFRRDESGAFLVLFGVLAIVLIATSGAVVDFTYMQTARSRAQTALDAAALGLQSKMATTDEAKLRRQAEDLVRERLADPAITVVVSGAAKDIANGKLNLVGKVTVPTAFVQLVGISSITANISSESTRGSVDLEVSVALDTTGSMAKDTKAKTDKIGDLINATNSLIDIVVQDTQPPLAPSYSKMAIVPYSSAVNVGTYADTVRGTVPPGNRITGAAWAASSAVTVTGVTNANPAVVTTSGTHGLALNDTVYFSGLKGMTQLNGNYYTVSKANTTTTFTLNLDTSNTKNYTAFASGNTPQVTKCQVAKCEVVVTSPSHGFNSSARVRVDGVGGMTNINATWPLTSTTTTTVVLNGSFGPSYPAYTSGGSLYCVTYGCQWYYFATAGSGYNTLPVTTCVSERTVNAYTDASPATTKLSYQYAPSGNSCITQTIMPLSTNKTALHGLAGSLTAGGSTAGHLGLAWAWYMLAPNFGSLWPAASQPAAYKKTNLIKAVILMTDGFFNSAYCNGVITGNLADSGSTSEHTACAPVDTSLNQAKALCTAIKASGITLYTVGFYIASNSSDDVAARTFLSACATDPGHFYQADNGAALIAAFKAIGQGLSELRLSK